MRYLLVPAAILLASAPLLAAESQPASQPSSQPASRVSKDWPKQAFDRGVSDASRQKSAGEQFCWVANSHMGQFVRAYQTWHDTAWLDQGVRFYDWCLDRMHVGPDGYKGWVGRYGDDANTWADVLVGDAILFHNMLGFSELVLKDDDLKKTYGDKARGYIDLAKKHLVEKWDSRGTWQEDGEFGGYRGWDMACTPADPNTWKKMPDPASAILSEPFNKQNDMAQCCMAIYRITGEKFYHDKAQKIFNFMRSRFQYVDGYYCWNYWEPFGPWDVNPETKMTRHFVNPHPVRNYQAGEISQIVDAYHTGIVFTQTDIERIIKTNLGAMWNKDKESPKFVNSNAALPKPELTEEEKKAEARKTAGCCWGALMDFNETVRWFVEPRSRAGKTDMESVLAVDYFKNVVEKTPVSFARRWAKGDVKLPELQVSPCRSLTMATVLPHIIKPGTQSFVLCKARIPEDLEVAVYSADGKDKKLTLYKGQVKGGLDGMAGQFCVEWDGFIPEMKKYATLPRGEYRMRWTVPDGYREFPVIVAE
jgi:hypothetical protein